MNETIKKQKKFNWEEATERTVIHVWKVPFYTRCHRLKARLKQIQTHNLASRCTHCERILFESHVCSPTKKKKRKKNIGVMKGVSHCGCCNWCKIDDRHIFIWSGCHRAKWRFYTECIGFSRHIISYGIFTTLETFFKALAENFSALIDVDVESFHLKVIR